MTVCTCALHQYIVVLNVAGRNSKIVDFSFLTKMAILWGCLNVYRLAASFSSESPKWSLNLIPIWNVNRRAVTISTYCTNIRVLIVFCVSCEIGGFGVTTFHTWASLVRATIRVCTYTVQYKYMYFLRVGISFQEGTNFSKNQVFKYL